MSHIELVKFPEYISTISKIASAYDTNNNNPDKKNAKKTRPKKLDCSFNIILDSVHLFLLSWLWTILQGMQAKIYDLQG